MNGRWAGRKKQAHQDKGHAHWRGNTEKGMQDPTNKIPHKINNIDARQRVNTITNPVNATPGGPGGH